MSKPNYNAEIKRIEQAMLDTLPDIKAVNDLLDNIAGIYELKSNEESIQKLTKLKEKENAIIEQGGDLFDKFFDSNYMQALGLLENVEAVPLKPHKEEGVQLAFTTIDSTGEIITRDEEEHYKIKYLDPGAVAMYTPRETTLRPDSPRTTAKEQAVIYFFLTHPNIDPAAKEHGFLSENAPEILNCFFTLDNFYYKTSKQNTKEIKIQNEFICFLGKRSSERNGLEAVLDNIGVLENLTPTAYKIPNTALMNALQDKGYINTGEHDLKVFGEDNPTTAYVLATYDENNNGIKLINNNLTQYQTDVSNAVITLWKQAQDDGKPPVFNIDMIYKNMPGGGERPSDKVKKDIAQIMDFFGNFDIELDATDEMLKRNKIKAGDSFTISEKYFNLREATLKIKNGGQTVKAYELLSTPLMWNYAGMTDQILTIPRKYLTISKVKNGKITGELIPMTDKRQSITSYLLKRIAIMKHAKKEHTLNKGTITDRINIETVFSKAEIEAPSKQNAAKYRSFIFEVLEYETAAGNIKGYEKIMNGRSLQSIKILL